MLNNSPTKHDSGSVRDSVSPPSGMFHTRILASSQAEMEENSKTKK